MGTDEMLGNTRKLQGSDLCHTSIPSRGSRNTASRFMLSTETGKSSGSHKPIGYEASLCSTQNPL